MGFKATLIIGEKLTSAAKIEAYADKNKYELVECEYEFYQSLDESGKPSSRPQSGLIKFVMPAQGDDDLFFYNWMFNRAETHDGTIEMLLSTDDNKKKYLHLYFEDAYMVNMYQYFNNNNSLLVRTKVTLSARKFTFGGSANFENDWKTK
ncbi:MAG: hypothetical protein J6K81_05400 [Rikenellaceae bacterium]|nr:hypothetical protein [Rikenellaceae bacterium]